MTAASSRSRRPSKLLQTIPGVGATAAATSVSEIGTAMGRFPSAKHLASWAGLCPGNKQRAGKRLSGKPTKGDTWLKAVLGEAAWAIARSRGNYLSAQDHRLARRRGKHKAAVAVAHSILVIAYHLLKPSPTATSAPTTSTSWTPSGSSGTTSSGSSSSATVTLTPKEAA